MNKDVNIDLSVKLGSMSFANPVIAASGTFGYGIEFAPFVDLNKLGGFCTKGLSLNPKLGNRVPRMVETSSGMLNAIGLENIGLEKFLIDKLPLLDKFKTRLIVNFFGSNNVEYIEMASALSDISSIDALEMNVSCPNVEKGGIELSSDPAILQRVVESVRNVTDKFLIVKLSPNVLDITKLAIAAENGGADAISLVNTYVGMKIDVESGKPWLANITGGLSGPAIKPIALAMVYKTCRAVKIPVIGIGGISSVEDALEFLMAGARAIQIGTANYIDPSITIKIIDGLRDYCQKNNLNSLKGLCLHKT
ncbi:MAG: dihydroorotate dehydrogenase [Rhodobiaceae bacterium]|nr:dihydroorotate dehydrogenase [Rhodobiaceae bacterium]